MFDEELSSFINKFRQLCHAGLDAHLAVDAHAEEAWVHLRVRLGKAPGPLYEAPLKTKGKIRNSPSRQRRRARRVAERLKKHDETEKVNNITDAFEAEEASVFGESESTAFEEAIKQPNDAIANESQVENHYNAEIEEICLECWHCDEVCLTEDDLEDHLRLIHGEVFESASEQSEDSEYEEYKCDVCNIKFKNAGQQRRHMKDEHAKGNKKLSPR